MSDAWKYKPAPVPFIPQPHQPAPAPLPFQPVPYVPVAPPQAVADERERGEWCDACGELIEWSEQCVELFPGVLARGSKSGQPVVVAGGVPVEELPPAIIHFWCIPDYYNRFIEDGEMPERLCAACEAPLTDDS